MKSFSWFICYCMMVIFYNICSMDKSDQVKSWKIILNHGVKFFDYIMIGTLVVNKYFDKILCKTAKERSKYLHQTTGEIKKYLQEYTMAFNCYHIPQYNEWCMYGAVNGNIVIKPINDLSNCIKIERSCLSGSMESFRHYNVDNFYDILPCQSKSFFNQEGDFCFYGYGEFEDIVKSRNGTVVEYSLCADGAGKTIECVTYIKDNLVKLKIFLEFPLLLQAFLNSSQTYKRKIGSSSKESKVFSCKGVIIPKDYMLHKQYFSDIKHGYFYDLPKVLCKEINSMYQKQGVK